MTVSFGDDKKRDSVKVSFGDDTALNAAVPSPRRKLQKTVFVFI